jgi:hypothetical protein
MFNYNKYIKYKNKYLKLKNQDGGKTMFNIITSRYNPRSELHNNCGPLVLYQLGIINELQSDLIMPLCETFHKNSFSQDCPGISSEILLSYIHKYEELNEITPKGDYVMRLVKITTTFESTKIWKNYISQVLDNNLQKGIILFLYKKDIQYGHYTILIKRHDKPYILDNHIDFIDPTNNTNIFEMESYLDYYLGSSDRSNFRLEILEDKNDNFFGEVEETTLYNIQSCFGYNIPTTNHYNTFNEFKNEYVINNAYDDCMKSNNLNISTNINRNNRNIYKKYFDKCIKIFNKGYSDGINNKNKIIFNNITDPLYKNNSKVYNNAYVKGLKKKLENDKIENTIIDIGYNNCNKNSKINIPFDLTDKIEKVKKYRTECKFYFNKGFTEGLDNKQLDIKEKSINKRLNIDENTISIPPQVNDYLRRKIIETYKIGYNLGYSKK